MYSVPGSVPGVGRDNGHPRKLISFLFVFGITLLCAGFLLSMFFLQTCPNGGFGDCKGALKIIGPLLAVVGLVCIILAQSRAKGYLQDVQLHDDQVYGFVFCRGNCQFAQFLVFGFLFLTSGMLISVLGIWIPGCSPGWRYQQQFNHSNTSSVELQDCGFHSIQTMGPLIVLIGLCFFVIAHIKKKQNINLIQESSAHEEEQLNPESFHVTVGDTVMVFPPPPPPYFADCSLQTVTPSLVINDVTLSENPPPYNSTCSNCLTYSSKHILFQGIAELVYFVMERNSDTVEDFSVNVFSVTSCQPNSSQIPVSDDNKAGTTLLFSGFFLAAVGITFTVMGWVKHEGVVRFVWTQLLGPVLLSVGVTFLLIAVCRFKVFICKSWNQSEERASDRNLMASGQSFVFTGISQPITFHGATVVQYIPSHETQEGVSMNSANFRQVLSHSAPVIPVPCPHYYSVSPLDNSVFSVDENHSAFFMVDTRSERSTSSFEEPQQMLDEDPCSDYLPPPYDKLFPPSS